jgi:hypothetical protein
MNRFYLMAQRAGMVLVVGLLFFILQGCTTPFVEVNVVVDGCCKDGDCEGRGTTAGCDNPPEVGTPTGLPAGTYDGITCNTGHVCGNMEGNTCARGKKCDTQHTSGSSTNCQCACVSNPD